MFKIISDRIYFEGIQVARMEPWLSETLRTRLSKELLNHLEVDQVEAMKRHVGKLVDEIEGIKTAPQQLIGARWQ